MINRKNNNLRHREQNKNLLTEDILEVAFQSPDRELNKLQPFDIKAFSVNETAAVSV